MMSWKAPKSMLYDASGHCLDVLWNFIQRGLEPKKVPRWLGANRPPMFSQSTRAILEGPKGGGAGRRDAAKGMPETTRRPRVQTLMKLFAS
eukprot:6323370-Pyramimonas_sp.AAC.1